MSAFFNYIPPLPEKPASKHPWETRIRPENAEAMKYAHNSTRTNPRYPINPKAKPIVENVMNQRHRKRKPEANAKKDKFTVIGIKLSKEFLYCKRIVRKLYKYKSRVYDEPSVTGVTTVDWPKTLSDLRLEHSEAYCTDSPVIVLLNGVYLGGHEQLKEHVQKKYTYHVTLDDYKESVKEFSNWLISTTRPFVYMHFSVDNKPLGTMIFMLYTDIVPETCENFMRLCCQTRGGYSGTPVHRVVKDCWIQCGGYSLVSSDLICENFIVDFDKRGVLAMANADIHVDCSTQFFIISQPAPWMKHHYVAFGQLIDGESTFKAIEETPTVYESPTQDIKIYKAGVINLECTHPIPVNKNARAYINRHVENIYEIREMVFEMIISSLYKEIEFRYLKSLEPLRTEGAEDHGEGTETVHPTESSNVNTKSSALFLADEENNEFDVDSYNYEPEEHYTYSQISISESPVIKPDEPFYLPLTDVIYPDEVDSTFDLKRYLHGEYCLAADVKTGAPKDYILSPQRQDSSILEDLDMSESSSESSLDEEVLAEMETYRRKHGEGMSLAGHNITKISRSLVVKNVLEYFYSNKANHAFCDEDVRKARRLDNDLKVTKMRKLNSKRAVSLTVCDDHVDRRIKRRPTGFLREEDVVKMIKARIRAGMESPDDDSESSESDGERPQTKFKKVPKVVINHPGDVPLSKKHKSILRDEAIPRAESTLLRLYSNVAMDEGEKPTLKDFRLTSANRFSEMKPGLFLTESQRIQMSSDDSDEYNRIRKEPQHFSAIAAFKVPEFEESPAARQLREQSIRSHQYKRTRPTMTVEQYQEKNHPKAITKPRSFTGSYSIGGSKMSGLRLPGDSPLYSDKSSSSKVLDDDNFSNPITENVN